MIMEYFEKYLRTLMLHFSDTFTRPFELTSKNIAFGVDTVSSVDLWSTSSSKVGNETKSLEISSFVEFIKINNIKV
ncbi:hypothetical protein X975_23410, partial [Stegodyphus mimosarum]